MNLIEKSLKIALEIHSGQVDKAGKPYILHPLRLMSAMETENEMSTALLHDIIEDSDRTPGDLEKAGIPTEVIEAVLCLTKKNDETYEDFIERLSINELARAVKIADLEDNINVLRLVEITEKDVQRLEKYHKAWKKLKELEK